MCRLCSVLLIQNRKFFFKKTVLAFGMGVALPLTHNSIMGLIYSLFMHWQQCVPNPSLLHGTMQAALKRKSH